MSTPPARGSARLFPENTRSCSVMAVTLDALSPKILLCLASAESEWAHPHQTLAQAFDSDRLNRILQWLPLLIARPGDRVATHNQPADPLWSPPAGVEICDLSHLSREELRADPVWLWAESHAASVALGMADRTSLLRTIASKDTLVRWGFAPPGSCWVRSVDELLAWKAQHPGPAVAKRALASSGRGHIFLPQDGWNESFVKERVLPLLQMEGGLVVQPWWERHLDFSTQWWCSANPTYLGATVMQNSPRGRYLGSLVGPAGWLEKALYTYWESHMSACRQVLQQVYKAGYEGPVGIDAMIVASGEGARCIPIVELNPRHTMGWLTLMLQRRSAHEWLCMEWRQSSKPGLFPSSIDHQSHVEHLGIQPHLIWSAQSKKFDSLLSKLSQAV